MPKSKQRKGHNKRIQSRAAVLKAQQKKFQKEMMEKYEEMRTKLMESSGMTENTETNEMGLIQPEANV